MLLKLLSILIIIRVSDSLISVALLRSAFRQRSVASDRRELVEKTLLLKCSEERDSPPKDANSTSFQRFQQHVLPHSTDLRTFSSEGKEESEEVDIDRLNYEEIGFDPYDENDDTDESLELEMAQELFDELRGGDEFISVERFMEWEDIVDVLEEGRIDLDTIQVLFEEVGVVNNRLTFPQFFEVVDLINQVHIALEGAEMFGDMSELDDEEGEDNDETEQSTDFSKRFNPQKG